MFLVTASRILLGTPSGIPMDTHLVDTPKTTLGVFRKLPLWTSSTIFSGSPFEISLRSSSRNPPETPSGILSKIEIPSRIPLTTLFWIPSGFSADSSGIPSEVLKNFSNFPELKILQVFITKFFHFLCHWNYSRSSLWSFFNKMLLHQLCKEFPLEIFVDFLQKFFPIPFSRNRLYLLCRMLFMHRCRCYTVYFLDGQSNR